MPYDSDTRRAIDLATYADEQETIDRLIHIAALSAEDRATLCLHGLADVSHEAYLALPIPPDP